VTRRRRETDIAALAVVLLAACSLPPDGQTHVGLGDCHAPIHYVALGDSTVEGVGASGPDLNYVRRLHARLRARYPNARVTNLGVGGATSADVMARQLDRAIRRRPDLVTLSIGPNDITRGIPVARYEQNLDVVLGRLRRETAALIVVNLLPDLAVTPRFAHGPHADVVGGQTVLFNEALARKAREYGATLVDLYLPSREEVPRHAALLWKDGYHPSDAGYARWAELMWEGIEPRLAAC
jgi:acyl-CoA thioesterase-1